ncbi:hypothetical protein KQX54_015608 [Cotesia glomerata]|uniref:Uncharacterized protein n=1 Tax=Cotesia glomerata TaxID=32391 RepID=A0AAV7I2P2_COTGL|nr:hypothetical protein KQX54_015608 [Cotesia glomerata]
MKRICRRYSSTSSLLSDNAGPQERTTPEIPGSTKTVSNDSAQGLGASGTTESATEASGSQDSAPKTSEEVKLSSQDH